VVTIAAELRIPLTPHAVVIERATASVQRMADLLEQAKRTGALQPFNRAYAVVRRQAKAEGRHPPTYGLALHRLKMELYKHAAGAPTIDGSMIARALGIVAESKEAK
jgi:hypothetical protein